MPTVRRSQRVVVCSAPEDEALRAALDAHLSLLERSAQITTFYSARVEAGVERDARVAAEIQGADVVLLLLSASFLDADGSFHREVLPAVERHRRAEAIVVAVVLRPVDVQADPFDELPFLPENRLAVTLWNSVDEALVNVERGLRRALEARARGERFLALPEPPDASTPALQTRALDAAVPARVTVDETAEVLAMITTEGSKGLRALIALHPQAFTASAEDVRSQGFALPFPLDAQGRPLAATVTLTLRARDFEPASVSKKLLVPPRSDSTVCTLLVTPKRAGHLLLTLELFSDEALVGAARLTTSGESARAPEPPSFVVTRLPLSTDAAPKPPRPKEAEPAATTARKGPAPMPGPPVLLTFPGPPPPWPPPWSPPLPPPIPNDDMREDEPSPTTQSGRPWGSGPPGSGPPGSGPPGGGGWGPPPITPPTWPTQPSKSDEPPVVSENLVGVEPPALLKPGGARWGALLVALLLLALAGGAVLLLLGR
jgi:hypothetical protein